MASREKRALSRDDDESDVKRSRVVEQDDENQQEESDMELDKDRETISLPDSDCYDLTSEEGGDVQEPEENEPEAIRPAAEETTPPTPPTNYNDFIEQENAEFTDTYKPWEGVRLEDGRPDPAYIAELENLGANEYEMYNHQRHTLWPKTYAVIQEYKKMEPDVEIFEINLCHESTMSTDFCDQFENAMETLLRQSRPRRIAKTDEEFQRKLDYDHRRKQELCTLANEYHDETSTHAGHQHKYAYMFPAHMSYDLIEYICVVMGIRGLPLSFLKNDYQKYYPEWDQITPEVREFFESCFLMDTSLREEFSANVNEATNFQGSDETRVEDLYDEMNKFFCYNFENFVIEKAMYVADKEIIFSYQDGILPPNSILLAETPEEAHRIFRERFNCPKN